MKNIYCRIRIIKMKIISFNVNGLRSIIQKENSIYTLIEKENPDILCLQEIKCLESQLPLEFIDKLKNAGYISIVFNSAKKKGYSGTAIFSKIKPLTITIGDDNEGRLIIFEYTKFVLFNMYVPNSKPDLSRLKERIELWETHIREKVATYKKQVILVGDFNVAPEEIDLKNYATNRGKHGFTNEEREAFRKLLQECKLVDSFRELYPTTAKYSWFSHFAKSRERNIGWRIDLAVVSKSLMKKITESDILCQYIGSDHCPISVTLSI